MRAAAAWRHSFLEDSVLTDVRYPDLLSQKCSRTLYNGAPKDVSLCSCQHAWSLEVFCARMGNKRRYFRFNPPTPGQTPDAWIWAPLPLTNAGSAPVIWQCMIMINTSNGTIYLPRADDTRSHQIRSRDAYIQVNGPPTTDHYTTRILTRCQVALTQQHLYTTVNG